MFIYPRVVVGDSTGDGGGEGGGGDGGGDISSGDAAADVDDIFLCWQLRYIFFCAAGTKVSRNKYHRV